MTTIAARRAARKPPAPQPEYLRGIKRKFAFYDTAAFFTRRLPPGARTHLSRIYGKPIRIDPAKPRINPRTGQRWSPGAIISPQRPTLELLRVLEGQYRATPSCIDPSLEYITDDPKPLWQALVDRLWMRWPTSRRRPLIVEGHTAYFARRGANRNVVLYWHKPSKITGEPCVRVDIRLRTRALHAQQLDSVDRLLAISINDVIDHNLRIADDNGDLVALPAALRPDRMIWPAQPLRQRPVTTDSMVYTTRSPTHATQARIPRPLPHGRQLWRANTRSSPPDPPDPLSVRYVPGPPRPGHFVYCGDQTREQLQRTIAECRAEADREYREWRAWPPSSESVLGRALAAVRRD
jgi:hypothetical protein